MTESDLSTTGETLSHRLSDLVTSEARSLVRHLESAKPYLSPANYQTWAAIELLFAASHQHEQRLTQLIKKHGLTLWPGNFQQEIAHYHDMGLEGLLPRLIEEKHRQSIAYQQALENSHDNPDVAEELQALREEIELQLIRLQAAKS